MIHNLIDTSEAFGSDYNDEDINRRIGFTYMWDWADIGADFITLGARTNTWDTVQTVPGREMFFYYNVKDFVPERWKTVYPIAAYSRMTERDAAWMARILARFTPDVVQSFARMADYTDPGDTAYLQGVLEGRLQKILERYLTRLSPIANVHVEGKSEVCGVDLAEWRRLREPAQFRYTASLVGGGKVGVERRPGAELLRPAPARRGGGTGRRCVALRDRPHRGRRCPPPSRRAPLRSWPVAGLPSRGAGAARSGLSRGTNRQPSNVPRPVVKGSSRQSSSADS